MMYFLAWRTNANALIWLFRLARAVFDASHLLMASHGFMIGGAVSEAAGGPPDGG